MLRETSPTRTTMSEKKMLVGYKGVKYGLQSRSNTEQKKTRSALAAFGGSSSSDDEDVATQVARHQAKKLKDAKVAAEHAAALAEDPSVYDYDGVYNEMHAAREEPNKAEKVAKRPKYIAALLETAARRNREQDVVYDRRMIKDRKKEDHLYGDKEVFVTTAYKKKLQEDKLWQEEQKQREALEEKSDVTKRKDLRDFYQNLYSSNHGFGEGPSGAERPIGSIGKSKAQESIPLVPATDGLVEAEDEPKTQPPSLSEYDRLRLDVEREGAGHPSRLFPKKPDEGIEAVSVSEGHQAAVQQRTPDTRKSHDGDMQENELCPASPKGETPANVRRCIQKRNGEDAVAAARVRYFARKKKTSV